MMCPASTPDLEGGRGERRSFEAVVSPEIASLWRAASAMTRNHHEAEDLLQDTLLRAFRAIDSFDGRYPRAWLFTILRNTHQNRNRRRRPEPVDPQRVDEGALGMNSSPGADTALLARAFDEHVEAALRALSPKLLQVVELVDISAFTYDEAALALGIPVATVTSRIHRARSRLREQIERTSRDGAVVK
jgi:RNA polymerase sigma-70 factor (ECF subfamily)